MRVQIWMIVLVSSTGAIPISDSVHLWSLFPPLNATHVQFLQQVNQWLANNKFDLQVLVRVNNTSAQELLHDLQRARVSPPPTSSQRPPMKEIQDHVHDTVSSLNNHVHSTV